jgi:hypothetical protein
MILADLSQPSLALTRIADLYLWELQAFGRLTSVEPKLNTKTWGTYVFLRANLIRSLLEVLESKAGLRFTPEDRYPFYYYLDSGPADASLEAWPSSAPPTGYTTDAPDVGPSTLATSLINGWWQRTSGTCKGRLFKAALWQVKASGLQSALTLAFDLHRTGFAATDDLYGAIRLLLHGRSHVSSDEAMVAAFVGDRDLDSASWRFLEPDTAWLESGEARADAGVIDMLLAQGSADIERVRHSVNYDEWHIGQVQLGQLLLRIRMLIDEFWGVGRLPLLWRAKLDQWEEIHCDAFGKAVIAYFPQAPLPTWDVTNASHANEVMEIYKVRGGKNWRSRFFRERLLVPERMQRHVTDDLTAPDAPDEWRGLSRRVIRPWMAACRDSAKPDLWRPLQCPAEELAKNPKVQAAFRAIGIDDHAEQLRMIRAYCDGKFFKEPRSSPPFTRWVNSDTPDEPAIIYTNMGLRKPSADEQRAFEVLHAVLPKAQGEYIANEQRQKGEPEARLKTYPYSVQALNQAVIQRIRRGDTEQAMEGLIDMVLLEPRSVFAWVTLTGYLAHLGHWREASIVEHCAAVAQSSH